jgi:hypothetical protein
VQVRGSEVTKEVLGMLSDNGMVTADVVKVIKGEILGYSSFLVRDVRFLDGVKLGGVELRGNARQEPTAVADILRTGLAQRCAPPPMHAAHA